MPAGGRKARPPAVKRVDFGRPIYYDEHIALAKERTRMSHKGISRKRKKGKQHICYDIQAFLREGLWFLVSIYMLLIIIVHPFYFTDGYSGIGTNKYEFFYNTGVAATVCILPLVCIYLGVSFYIKYKLKKEMDTPFCKLSVTDKFVLGYGATVLLSYFFSAYREVGAFGDVWKGTTGWFMGACSQLMFVGIYFVVSRFWEKSKVLPALWLPVLLVVFLLEIANRFSLRPIEMEGSSPWFISTIGNINWYCGYIVILLFGVMYYFWTDVEKKSYVRILLAIWLTIGFVSLVTQGSLSGLLALGAVMICLYMLSARDGERLEQFFACLLCLGLACSGVYFLRARFADKYNYKDPVWDYFTNHPLAVIILLVSLAAWGVVKYLNHKGKMEVKVSIYLGYVGCTLAGVGLLVYIVLLIINTKVPGSIGALSENPWFTFDNAWGSSRGATLIAAWKCFVDQDLWSKIVGVGPDAMVMYINSEKNPELYEMVREVFGRLNLTNAHNEWLTILVNEGLLGLITYAGIMISAIVRYLKGGRNCALTGACGMAVLAYTVNNMVSFQQAMAATTLFLVLGMGEACMRSRTT